MKFVPRMEWLILEQSKGLINYSLGGFSVVYFCFVGYTSPMPIFFVVVILVSI